MTEKFSIRVQTRFCLDGTLVHWGHFHTVMLASTPIKYWCPGHITEQDK